jgi:hypothetical protein
LGHARGHIENAIESETANPDNALESEASKQINILVVHLHNQFVQIYDVPPEFVNVMFGFVDHHLTQRVHLPMAKL